MRAHANVRGRVDAIPRCARSCACGKRKKIGRFGARNAIYNDRGTARESLLMLKTVHVFRERGTAYIERYTRDKRSPIQCVAQSTINAQVSLQPDTSRLADRTRAMTHPHYLTTRPLIKTRQRANAIPSSLSSQSERRTKGHLTAGREHSDVGTCVSPTRTMAPRLPVKRKRHCIRTWPVFSQKES